MYAPAYTSYKNLDIQVFDVEGVLFDELAAAFDVFAHEGGEDIFGGVECRVRFDQQGGA
jgi:predicted methyltransferase